MTSSGSSRVKSSHAADEAGRSLVISLVSRDRICGGSCTTERSRSDLLRFDCACGVKVGLLSTSSNSETPLCRQRVKMGAGAEANGRGLERRGCWRGGGGRWWRVVEGLLHAEQTTLKHAPHSPRRGKLQVILAPSCRRRPLLQRAPAQRQLPVSSNQGALRAHFIIIITAIW